MQDYDFTLKHIPGKTNTKADILSRKDQVNTKKDNKDVQLLKDKLWQRRMTAEIAIMGENKAREESGILKEIRRIETREKKVIQVLQLSTNFFTGLSLNTRSFVLNSILSPFFQSLVSFLPLSACLFILSCALFSAAPASSCILFILSTNSPAFSTFPFFLMSPPFSSLYHSLL